MRLVGATEIGAELAAGPGGLTALPMRPRAVNMTTTTPAQMPMTFSLRCFLRGLLLVGGDAWSAMMMLSPQQMCPPHPREHLAT